jgi:hydrogenase maturation protein HypF
VDRCQYAHELATRPRTPRGLVVEVEGDPGAVEEFVARLPHEVPPMVVIERVETRALRARWQGDFTIVSNGAHNGHAVPVFPDIALRRVPCRAG